MVPFIIIIVILYLIFLGSRIAVINIVFVLVIILDRLGIVGVVVNGVVKVGDILLGILVIILLVRRVGGLLTSQPEVGLGAGNTVHTKGAVEVTNYLGLEMDGSLDSALVDTLDGLFDAADSADIVA